MRLIGLTDIDLGRSTGELLAEWQRICNADHLTFGVEIEVCYHEHYDRYHVRDALVDGGVQAIVSGYEAQPVWKIVHDSSCGYEIVSPVLQGNEGLLQVAKVADILANMGLEANRNCGLHLHIGAGHMSVDQMRDIVKRWINNEEHLDAIQPRSRRSSNPYCRSAKGYFDMDGLNKAQTVSDLANAQEDRYCKINLRSFQRHGTIEFRHHSGTVEADKIVNWIKFIRAFVVLTNEHTIEDKGFDYLFGTDDVRSFYTQRKEVLC